MRELAHAVQDGDEAEDLTQSSPPVPVRQGAGGAAQQTGGQVAGHEEDGDVRLAEAVLAVQLVDVGPLQPVREESQQVGGEVEPLQAHQAGALTGPANTPLSSAAPGFEMNQSGEAAD